MNNLLKKSSAFLLGALFIMLSVSTTSCAWIFNGFKGKAPEERTHSIQAGYLVLDILFTGVIGVVVDFATGAIYKSASPEEMSFYKNPVDVCEEGKQLANEASSDNARTVGQELSSHLQDCDKCQNALSETEVKGEDRISLHPNQTITVSDRMARAEK